MQNVINDTINKVKKNQEKNENDYYNEENILICGKCHTEKEFRINGNKVPCLCECQMKRYEEEEKIIKRQSFLRNNEYLIEKEYRNLYFNDVDNSSGEFDFAFNFVENFEEIKKLKTGLYIYGDTGNGKTTIAKAIANELFNKEYRVLMLSFNKAIDKINEDNGNTQENSNHFKQTIRNCDLIILDDFGSTNPSEFQLKRIYNLINYLYENRKIVIITSNISRKDLGVETEFSQKRIFDRIIEMTYGVLISGVGIRKKIARNKINEMEKILKGE